MSQITINLSVNSYIQLLGIVKTLKNSQQKHSLEKQELSHLESQLKTISEEDKLILDDALKTNYDINTKY